MECNAFKGSEFMQLRQQITRIFCLLAVCCLCTSMVPASAAEQSAPALEGWAAADAATTTITVAASDSSAEAKSQADYVCDGVNDHSEIQAALKDLPAEGGIVLMTEGTFNCAGNLQPEMYKTLKGAGQDKTILKFPGDGGPRVRSNYVTFSDFTILGKADLLVLQNHARVHNITMTVDNSRIGAFYIWAPSRVIEDVEFVNCTAIDCGRYGFINSGEGTPKKIKNVRYIDCKAINCGKDSYVNTGPWVTGFDLAEYSDVEDIYLEGCYAEGNQESGFHLEGFYWLSTKNVTFKDCVSVNNAAKGKDNAMFGGGFTTPKGANFENCTTAGNKHGFLMSGGSVSQCSDNNLVNCTDIGSDYGFMFRHGYNSTFVNCVSKDAGKQGIVLAKAWNMTVKNFTVENATGHPAHAGFSIITAAKFAGMKTADDPFAGGMWHGPLTDSTIDINVRGCDSNTALYFGYSERVKVTGSIVTDAAEPIQVVGGTDVDTTGVVVQGSESIPAEPESTPESVPAIVKPVQTPWPVSIRAN